ncbi:3-keto-disaccharide hydrolase [Haloferula sp.]|uniref:3-keto-disaccharide hydrolase n=1 Tax=Haloferula sp. TaxID=2497595 RepID=UPI003C765383
MKASILFPALLATSLSCAALPLLGKPTWTDPAKAAAEDPDFNVQGEYVADGKAAQVVATGNGRFIISEYVGGLPGAGWDGSKITRSSGDKALVSRKLAKFERIEREVPTLGAKPPEGAVVLFDGEGTGEWNKAKVEDGFLMAGTTTKRKFKDFKLHLEFRLPYKPETPLSHQDRGNSGIYIFDRYEVQILDSFGLDYDLSTWDGENLSDSKQWCGSFYKFKTPDVPMCLPPLTWQSYDIDFTAPKLEGGKKVSNARVTVFHNGVKIHDDLELPKGTGNGGKLAEVPEGSLQFQGHGNPVQFRNVWIEEK